MAANELDVRLLANATCAGLPVDGSLILMNNHDSMHRRTRQEI